MHEMTAISRGTMSLDLDDNSEQSPTDFIAEKYFPIKDFELLKVYDYHMKIIDELKYLIKVMEENKGLEDQMENSEEYIKLKKRAVEYGIRFSRHHLYPLKREIENIKNFLEINKPLKNRAKEILKKKLISTYQNTLQSIQSFKSYRIAQNLPVNNKLKEMVLLILTYNDITKNLLIPIQKSVGGNNEELADTCKKIIEIVNFEFKRKKIPQKIKKVKKQCKELNIATNLSMYEPKLGDWTMKSQALARLRFGQILKTRNSKKMGVVKSQSTFSDRSMKTRLSAKGPKRRVDEVLPTEDIETEIEKFHIDTSRRKENIPKKKQISETSLKGCVIVQEPKNDRHKIEKSKSCEKNVGFFHFISDADEKIETDISSIEEDLKLVKSKKEQPTTFPFLPPKKENNNNNTLTISDNVIQDLKSMINCRYLKPNLEEEEESWNIISRISDSILKKMISEILEEVYDDKYMDQLYENELKTKKMTKDCHKLNK